MITEHRVVRSIQTDIDMVCQLSVPLEVVHLRQNAFLKIVNRLTTQSPESIQFRDRRLLMEMGMVATDTVHIHISGRRGGGGLAEDDHDWKHD